MNTHKCKCQFEAIAADMASKFYKDNGAFL